jgi:hypothetical protein
MSGCSDVGDEMSFVEVHELVSCFSDGVSCRSSCFTLCTENEENDYEGWNEL